MFDENNTGLTIDGSYVEGYFEGNLVFEIGFEEQFLEFKSNYGYIGYDYPLKYVWAETILDGNSNEINTNDLERGSRIYKHRILINDTQNDYAFYFEFYNSSPDEIDDVDIIAYDKQFELCTGMFVNRNTTPYTHEVGIISEIDQGDIHVLHGNTERIFGAVVVTDTVTQC